MFTKTWQAVSARKKQLIFGLTRMEWALALLVYLIGRAVWLWLS